MTYTHPRPEFRSSRTSAAILLALFTLVSPLSPLFAGAARAQGAGARRPASGNARAGQPADKGVEAGGGVESKSPKLDAPALPSAVVVTATMDDGVGPAAPPRPGDTITYAVTISNTGSDPATGVKYTNDLSANPNLTFNVGSVQTQPLAIKDTYNAIGNVRIALNAAQGLLANDCDLDNGVGCNDTDGTAPDSKTGLTVTAIGKDSNVNNDDNTAPFSVSSANNGQVTAAAGDGSFVYNPAPGFAGIDTFTYIVTDATGKTDRATVTINVGNGTATPGTAVIWFIDDSAPAGGDGRLSSPFNCYTGTSVPVTGPTCYSDTAAKSDGDIIFLYEGNYTGGNALMNSQMLVGQDASDPLLTIAGFTAPAPNLDPALTFPQTKSENNTLNAPPTITATSANGVPVAQNNVLRGFNVGSVGNANSKIAGTGFGTLTIGKFGAPDVSLLGSGAAMTLSNGSFGAGSSLNSVAAVGVTGVGLSLATINSGGGLTIAGGTSISNSTGVGISVNASQVSIAFGDTNVTSSGGTGVSLVNNTGAISFGDLDIAPNSGQQGLVASGNNSLVATSGTISTTGAQAVNITNTVINLPFDAVSADNDAPVAVPGISLTTTVGTLTAAGGSIFGGSAPAFLVDAGSASASYGGSITQATNNTNAALVSVTGGHDNTGVAGSGTITFTGALSATNGTGLQFNNADGVYNFNGTTSLNGGNAGIDILNGSAGAFAFGGTTITNPTGVALDVQNSSGGISISGAISKNNDGNLIDFNNYDSGTATLSGNLSCTTGCDTVEVTNDGASSGVVNFSGGTKTLNTGASTAVNLDNNDGGSVNFTNGGLNIDTTSGVGFNATNGGTVTVTGAVNVIDTTTTGTGLNIAGTTIGANGVTFEHISVNGAPSGIVLDGTGTSGPFLVSGDSGTARNGSGGTIQNTTSDGVRLNNAHTVTLQQVNLTNTGDLNNAGLSTNETAAGEHGVEMTGGTSDVILSAIAVTNPGGSGVMALNTTGTSRVNLDSLFNNHNSLNSHGVFVNNQSGFSNTLFEIDNTDFTNFTSTAAAVEATNEGTGNVTIEVKNGIFEALRGQGVLMTGGNALGTTGTVTSDVHDNLFRNAVQFLDGNNVPGSTQNNVAALVSNGATHNAQIRNNVLDNVAEYADLANESIIRTQNSGGKMTVSVVNNEIKNINFAQGAGGRHAIGHVFEPSDNVFNAGYFSNVTIDGNTANNVTFTATQREFAFVDFREFASGGSVSIKNNLWNMPTAFVSTAEQAVELRFRQRNSVSVNVGVTNNGVGTKNGVTGATSNTPTSYLDIDAEESVQLSATITGNTFTDSNTGGNMISVSTEDSAAAGGPPTACYDISGNTLTPTAGGNTISFSESAGTMNVEQANIAAVSTVNNGATAGVSAGSPTFGVTCSNPPIAPDLDVFAVQESAAPSARQQAGEQPLTIPGLMITQPQQPQQQAPGQTDVPPAAPPAPAAVATQASGQADALTAAKSEKSADAQGSKAGREATRKDGLKVGVAQPSSGTLDVTIGTLPAGDSVTITYTVTIADTITPAAASSVSNQGTVSSTTASFSNVLTDDTDAALVGASDPTVTPINKFEPTITLGSSDTTTDQGENVTFTATLTRGTATVDPLPTGGTVNFVDQTDLNPVNWETLCSGVALTVGAASSTAQCATTAVDAGPRNIVAVYSGDGRYDPATSNTVVQTVTACQSAITVTSTADSGAGSLREAITNACSGATITFDIAGAGPHTITLNPSNGALLIQKNLTVTGPTNESVIISGGNADVRALNVTNGTVNISNLTVSGAKPTTGSGGGLLVTGATTVVTLTGMTFNGNSALNGSGGAISVQDTDNALNAVLNVINTTVSGNAANAGGGLHNDGSTLNLTNVTVTLNDAQVGGVSGTGQGGGLYSQSGTTNVRNTILSGNLGQSTFENVLGSLGVNADNLIGGDAGLDPVLASNGGPTQTHKLLAGSAALDAGNDCVLTAGGCVAGPPADPAVAVTTDQRGLARKADAADADTDDEVDIGAFEAQVSIPNFADAPIAQDTVYKVENFSVGDSTSALTVSATSGDTTLFPSVVVGPSNPDTPDKRTLTITPGSGLAGSATITVTVTNGTQTMTDTFLLTVNPAVPKAASTVVITADDPDPSNSGTSVPVLFEATGTGATPTGNVVITVSDGSVTETCTGALDATGKGQCNLPLDKAGTRLLTATYSGDAVYNGDDDTEQHVVLPNVSISDASGPEPATGSDEMTFTVRLSAPAVDLVSVDYEVAAGGANPATPGSDYTGGSGIVTFAAGQVLQTISVPVLSDADNSETDETFLVNITSAKVGVVSVTPTDAQAVGTIKVANPPGAILISEVRTSGPDPDAGGAQTGAENDYIELYNNSDSPVTVPAGGWGIFQSGEGVTCSADPVLIATIPGTTTVIPARGHYLIYGSEYNLSGYAAGDQTFDTGKSLASGRNIGLFSTTDVAMLSTATRLDAVGFGLNTDSNCDLLREGTPLNTTQDSTSEYAFYRKLATGRPQDTNASTADFQLVSTTPATDVGFNLAPLVLGAPGPEDSDSPVQRNDKVKASLIDPNCAILPVDHAQSPTACAQERNTSPVANGSQGTFTIRRRFTNNTGAAITQLRFRIVDLTTLNSPGYGAQADLRAITSGDVTANILGGGTVAIKGTTVESPSGSLGGGLNSTFASAGLAPGASINLQFVFGVEQAGAFRFFVNVEAGPPPAGPIAPAKVVSQPGKADDK